MLGNSKMTRNFAVIMHRGCTSEEHELQGCIVIGPDSPNRQQADQEMQD